MTATCFNKHHYTESLLQKVSLKEAHYAQRKSF